MILHYDDTSGMLRDLYFIDPHWLCDLMAEVVTLKSCGFVNSNGVLRKSDLAVLLRKEDRFPTKSHQSFIELLNRFQLTFSLNNELVLVPSKLPEDKPAEARTSDLEWIPIKRIYRLAHLPYGFCSRLIARLLHNLSDILAEAMHVNKGGTVWNEDETLDDLAKAKQQNFELNSCSAKCEEAEEHRGALVSDDEEAPPDTSPTDATTTTTTTAAAAAATTTTATTAAAEQQQQQQQKQQQPATSSSSNNSSSCNNNKYDVNMDNNKSDKKTTAKTTLTIKTTSTSNSDDKSNNNNSSNSSSKNDSNDHNIDSGDNDTAGDLQQQRYQHWKYGSHKATLFYLVWFTVLLSSRKHDAWLAANGGKRADTAAEQLIASPRTHDLKVERLIKLTQLFGAESDAEGDGIFGGNHPAVANELRSRGRQNTLTK